MPKISSAVIRRIPKYYRYVDELYKKGIQRVSSRVLAEDMGLTASQVRQDFSCFGGFGQQGYGYNTESLRDELADILNLNNGYTAVLIGVGNLGLALINNFNFEANGFKLLSAFDVDKTKIGKKINGIEVRSMDSLYSFCEEHKPELAVLTCPGNYANDIAAKLVEKGVLGLWNFTNVDIYFDNIKDYENKVVLENVHFSDSLMTLGCRIPGVKK